MAMGVTTFIALGANPSFFKPHDLTITINVTLGAIISEIAIQRTRLAVTHGRMLSLASQLYPHGHL